MTPKQERFVAEYLVDLNGTQAAIRAGYSRKTAGQQAEQLLKKLEIAAAVRNGQAKAAERAGRTAADVIAALWRESSETGIGASHSARVSALNVLAKHFGLLVDRHEHSGPGGEPIPTRLEVVIVDGADAEA